jgi:hypothetical protein
MLEQVTRLAEKVASHAGVSRRGFLERIGRGAVALAGVLGGALALAGAAQAGSACMTNQDCGPGRTCVKNGCTGPGNCIPRTLLCSPNSPPVCGCDGKTYGNVCDAINSGHNVRHPGPC